MSRRPRLPVASPGGLRLNAFSRRPRVAACARPRARLPADADDSLSPGLGNYIGTPAQRTALEEGYRTGSSHAFRLRCQMILLKSERHTAAEIADLPG